MKFKVSITEYTKDDFFKYVGRLPEEDDLHRANCNQAGEDMHRSCGICIHFKPVFCCHECFVDAELDKDNFVRLTDTLADNLNNEIETYEQNNS